MTIWTRDSWQRKLKKQLITYPEPALAEAVKHTLSELPPLVTPMEVEALKAKLARAEQGECFLLQGGDCAERFSDCTSSQITSKLKIMLQMSLILIHGLKKPIIRVGRIAGQYAKPRSQELETRDGVTLPSYRGDIINAPEFSEQARTPDPARMLEAYHFSALTLNYLRALIDGGFADLEHPEYWQIDFVKHSPLAGQYEAIVRNISDALSFFKTIASLDKSSLNNIAFYTSHEALHLDYESALTHEVDGRFYNLGTHLPWLGMRTADLENAHVEYLRGIANPIGIKIGPTIAVKDVLALLDILNPHNEQGKIILIHRFGVKHIETSLPPLIEAIRHHQKSALFCVDPMHGNTQLTEDGIKTRHFDDILSEVNLAFKIHQKMGVALGGIHFEMTGENVTECIGGAKNLTAKDLNHAYKSLVDPRLNYEQSLEMALRIVHDYHLALKAIDHETRA